LTATGAALRLMGKELKNFGQRALPPVIILISDGDATDDYDGGIVELLSHRWGKKAVRIAIAIHGAEMANIAELQKFCSNPEENHPLVANTASELVRYIKWATVEVSKSVSNSVISLSKTKTNVNLPPPPKPQVTIGGSTSGGDDGDPIF